LCLFYCKVFVVNNSKYIKQKRKKCYEKMVFSSVFEDMFIQSCLQRTISNSQLIISIRTFKRFGEYVKNYGHEPKYYQGGILIFI
jgi:hypothetical protein